MEQTYGLHLNIIMKIHESSAPLVEGNEWTFTHFHEFDWNDVIT